MDEFKTDRSVFTPHDFVLWQANQQLEISPKFQRRSVWRPAAQSYFIDTLLRGMTVPPLYFRMVQNPGTTKVIREVVDGQQRVRSVLNFISETGYRLSTTLTAPWAGKRFSQLTIDEQRRIMSYGFPAEIFKGISDPQVFQIFGRLNTNGIPLNKQELRNGKYFGRFKQSAFDLAVSYLEFWRKHKVFTEINIARMLEVELTSELLIAGHAGMQDKKNTIETYYENWEQSYPGQDRDERRFGDVLAAISDTFPGGELAESQFRRSPLFYTLYCAVYHHIFGLEGATRASPKKKLTADDRDSLRRAVLDLSDVIVQSKDLALETPKKHTAFVAACLRQTDNIGPRTVRFNSLFGEAF